MAKEHPDQYDIICKDRFDKMEKILTNIDKKLFRGNGSPPWDVRIDRVERLSKVLVWVGALMTTTSFVVIGKLAYDFISK